MNKLERVAVRIQAAEPNMLQWFQAMNDDNFSNVSQSMFLDWVEESGMRLPSGAGAEIRKWQPQDRRTTLYDVYYPFSDLWAEIMPDIAEMMTQRVVMNPERNLHFWQAEPTFLTEWFEDTLTDHLNRVADDKGITTDLIPWILNDKMDYEALSTPVLTQVAEALSSVINSQGGESLQYDPEDFELVDDTPYVNSILTRDPRR